MRNKRNIPYTIGIVVLSLSLALLILLSVGLFRDANYSYTAVKEESLYYDVQQHDYAYLLRAVKNNNAIGYKPSQTEQEYYALADYYDSAFHYQMYVVNDVPDKAAVCKTQMEEAAGQVGFLETELPYIREQLGIDK